MYVIGTSTLSAHAGLKRHRLKASSVALSRIMFRQVCVIRTPVTLPIAGSTLSSAMPDPIIRWRRASYGYTGRGAYMTSVLTELNAAFVPLKGLVVRIFL